MWSWMVGEVKQRKAPELKTERMWNSNPMFRTSPITRSRDDSGPRIDRNRFEMRHVPRPILFALDIQRSGYGRVMTSTRAYALSPRFKLLNGP